MNLRSVIKRSLLVASAVLAITAIGGTVNAATFTVKNNCGYTVYPGLYPAVYDNGGWSMAAGSSVSFSVSATFNGRIWGRQNCNGSSPAQCAAGSCGGTGLQCAGTTGTVGTSLAEFNLDASGTDWYDVSYVDGIDTPIGLTLTNTSCYQPNTAKSFSCPTAVVNGVDCVSPCTQTGSAQFCCAGAYNTSATCIVANWPAADQAYVTDIHTNCPGEYAYAYDDPVGLHTCPTGSGNNYVITFCPSGSGSTTGSTTGGTTGSTTGGGAPSAGVHTLTPGNATGSRLDDNAGATTNGTKIQIWGANGTAAQQWNFASVGTNTWNLAVNLGPYCLDGGAAQVGTATQLWGCNGTADQAWVSGPAAQSGAYNFASKQSGLCLDVAGAGTGNGTVVQEYTCNGTPAQAWTIN